MAEPAFDQEETGRGETGFAFSDEDYTRRYAPDKSPVATQSAATQSAATQSAAPQSVAPQSAAPRSASPSAAPSSAATGGLHGGGNSFMRARRRRLAASASG
jgi:hypothetical protein